MTDIKPCTVKGCRETIYHHHYTPGIPGAFECDSPNSCVGVRWLTFGPVAAPARPTRKALNARIAALEAENADLHAEIADKKDRLARLEKDPDAAVVEAMSAAMYAARCEVGRAEYPEAAPWEECTARTRDTYRASARAALKAAREAGAL